MRKNRLELSLEEFLRASQRWCAAQRELMKTIHQVSTNGLSSSSSSSSKIPQVPVLNIVRPKSRPSWLPPSSPSLHPRSSSNNTTKSTHLCSKWAGPLLSESCAKIEKAHLNSSDSFRAAFDEFSSQLLRPSRSDDMNSDHFEDIVNGLLHWQISFVRQVSKLTEHSLNSIPKKSAGSSSSSNGTFHSRSRSMSDENSMTASRLGLCGTIKSQSFSERQFKSQHRENRCRNVVQVASGKNRYLLLDASNVVFDSSISNIVPALLIHSIFTKHRKTFVSISCGLNHCLAVSSLGEVFTWGSNRFGQLGHGGKDTTPRIVTELLSEPIKKAACGAYHTIAVSQRGGMFTWGCGARGRLGHGDENDQYRPKRLQRTQSSWKHTLNHLLRPASSSSTTTNDHKTSSSEENQFKTADCGHDFTVAIDASNNVVCMGEGKDLQCGSSKNTKLYFDTPQQIGLKAILISCGFMHTLALSRDRMEIFSWGSGAALGLGQTNTRSDIPKLVLSMRGKEKKDRFDSICSGFYHSTALTELGYVYVWGKNMEGQLGLGINSKTDALMVWNPTILPELKQKVRSISCGENFTAAILGSVPSGCDTISKLHGASIGASISASQRRSAIESRTNREMMWKKRVSKEFQEYATGTRERVSDRSTREWKRGVPSSLRSEMWPLVIGNAAKVTKHMFEHHGRIAEQCLSRARTSGKDETFHLNADSIKLISADIPRTFSRNEIGILFETRTGPLYRDLRQILLAFALFRQDIGYVQGMTFLAAFLLIHLSCDTFSAFRCFSNLMLKQHLYTFYSVRSKDMRKYFELFDTCASMNTSTLFLHLQDMGIETKVFLYPWLQTVFLKLPLDVSTVSRIWDGWLLEGTSYLFRISISILELFELDLQDMEMEDALPLLLGKHSTSSIWSERVTEDSLFQTMSRVNIPSDVMLKLHELERKSV